MYINYENGISQIVSKIENCMSYGLKILERYICLQRRVPTNKMKITHWINVLVSITMMNIKHDQIYVQWNCCKLRLKY